MADSITVQLYLDNQVETWQRKCHDVALAIYTGAVESEIDQTNDELRSWVRFIAEGGGVIAAFVPGAIGGGVRALTEAVQLYARTAEAVETREGQRWYDVTTGLLDREADEFKRLIAAEMRNAWGTYSSMSNNQVINRLMVQFWRPECRELRQFTNGTAGRSEQRWVLVESAVNDRAESRLMAHWDDWRVERAIGNHHRTQRQVHQVLTDYLRSPAGRMLGESRLFWCCNARGNTQTASSINDVLETAMRRGDYGFRNGLRRYPEAFLRIALVIFPMRLHTSGHTSRIEPGRDGIGGGVLVVYSGRPDQGTQRFWLHQIPQVSLGTQLDQEVRYAISGQAKHGTLPPQWGFRPLPSVGWRPPPLIQIPQATRREPSLRDRWRQRQQDQMIRNSGPSGVR